MSRNLPTIDHIVGCVAVKCEISEQIYCYQAYDHFIFCFGPTVYLKEAQNTAEKLSIGTAQAHLMLWGNLL